MRIAISGAGIAGPTLAYWLQQSSHDVLLVEQAPRLRGGGYVVDFWGLGYDIAEKMGLLPHVRALGYQVQEVRFVDRNGRTSASFSTDVIRRLTSGRFTSIRRSDLSALIYRALNDRVETIFGDSIAGIRDTGRCVRLSFEHSAPRDVDLVVGADGLHSRVRRLVFGAQERFEVALGYHVAAFEVDGYRPRDDLVYVSHAVPGRQISRFSLRGGTTLFLFVFRDEHAATRRPENDREARATLRHVFADAGWESSEILAAMERASEIYFDRVSQIRMDRWMEGRVALIGDAAACASLLAGEGTGLAMAEAYVLAGELRVCGSDHSAALARYQARLMPFLARKQTSAARFAGSFAPTTACGLRLRDLIVRLLRFPRVAEFFIGRDLRDDFTLPDYGFSSGPVAIVAPREDPRGAV
jgi:2-polyprenyl-6-methoxyphenol hydroxylase-like FAD-dependent oxidoreductase